MDKHAGPHHQKLSLKNFTAFSEADLEFVPGVNAFIGENGTGKTHIMKALYAAQMSWTRSNRQPYLEQSFQVDLVSGFVRRGSHKGAICRLSGVFGDAQWAYQVKKEEGYPSFVDLDNPPRSLIPVFIPAIDMMGHTKGFVSTYDNFKIDFNLTHREIVSLLLSPERRQLPETLHKMVSVLESVIGGSVELEGERFYLKSDNWTLPMPSVAEGLRKIATLIRLIQGGWLVPGATLFWDEPEVNLNPILMDEVIGAILTLARSGVQVFLATHSYVILKELEVQSTKQDKVRYFALGQSNAGTQVFSASTYLDLHPNKIEEQYSDLYDRRIDRLSGAARAS